MRRLGRFSVTLGAVAFAALPILASGCAETQSTDAPPAATDGAGADTADDGLGDLSDDLGAPAESGSDLGVPESGSALE